MYQLPRLTNNTPTFLRDMIVSYEEPTFETLPLDPFAPPPPPPHPPQPPAPLPVLNRFFHRTQMDTVQEQFQVMAFDAVEDNQDQDHQDHQDHQDQDQDQDEDDDEDEDVEMMDDSVEEFGFEEAGTHQHSPAHALLLPNPTLAIASMSLPSTTTTQVDASSSSLLSISGAPSRNQASHLVVHNAKSPHFISPPREFLKNASYYLGIHSIFSDSPAVAMSSSFLRHPQTGTPSPHTLIPTGSYRAVFDPTTRLPPSSDEFDQRRSLEAMLLEGARDRETKNARGALWLRTDSSNYNTGRETRVSASMIICPKSVPSKNVGGDRRPQDHEILFYNLDLTNPSCNNFFQRPQTVPMDHHQISWTASSRSGHNGQNVPNNHSPTCPALQVPNPFVERIASYRLTNNTPTLLCDTVISYQEPLPFEILLAPLAPLPPPPPPPLDQMDTVPEQFQAMAIGAVEDNQDQGQDHQDLDQDHQDQGQDQDEDEDVEMMDASDPLDLLRFSNSCLELLFFTAPVDWYYLATHTNSSWVASCGRADENDWKEIVLRDAALGARLGTSLPTSPTTLPPQTTSSLTVAPVLPSSQFVVCDFDDFASFFSLTVVPMVRLYHSHPAVVSRPKMTIRNLANELNKMLDMDIRNKCTLSPILNKVTRPQDGALV
ncbi:MAG: hypothetical protein J3R72DRAFT_527781 [Linnemannia gamsii]|nr:MAG: hypothetical protein J3R72DRAFT_527781 [Linnemannia gamsii]